VSQFFVGHHKSLPHVQVVSTSSPMNMKSSTMYSEDQLNAIAWANYFDGPIKPNYIPQVAHVKTIVFYAYV